MFKDYYEYVNVEPFNDGYDLCITARRVPDELI